MQKKFIIKILCLFLIFLKSEINAYENKIVVKVDNEIITSIDILNEIDYLTFINKDLKKFEKEKIYEISKNSLIREKVKKIEVLKNFNEMKVDEQYLDAAIKNYITRLNISSFESFTNQINKYGLDIKDIKQRFTIELLWNQLIYKKYSNSVKVDKELIKKEFQQTNKQKEFLLSEIVFNVQDNENIQDKYKLIENTIKEQDFNRAAAIHSTSDSASSGGILGWIKQSSIDPKINNELKNITINQFTKPIVVPGGFLILKINNIRETEKKNNSEKEVELIFEEKVNQQLNQFSNIYFNKVLKSIAINEI
ncbi:MAG: peptidylprolyl isomerase [Alphaproteobacteria bacterium]|nr:peptidylprolyl isomerase [Alphaproteobacteria bacterium]